MLLYAVHCGGEEQMFTSCDVSCMCYQNKSLSFACLARVGWTRLSINLKPSPCSLNSCIKKQKKHTYITNFESKICRNCRKRNIYYYYYADAVMVKIPGSDGTWFFCLSHSATHTHTPTCAGNRELEWIIGNNQCSDACRVTKWLYPYRQPGTACYCVATVR